MEGCRKRKQESQENPNKNIARNFNPDQINPKEDTPRHGLALGNQTSVLNQVELVLSQKSQQNGHKKLHMSPPHRKPNRKATNIPALSLKIGNWEWESINEGDLVAKFYYGTKKLVREVLLGSMKKKIAFRWSQISVIKAYLDGNQTSRLDIQLKEPSRLCEETKLNPKMHTKWRTARVILLEIKLAFAAKIIKQRVLDDQFAKLLECDERLSNLIKQPFPYQYHVFFEHQILDFSYNISNHAVVPNKDQKGMSVPYAPIVAQPVSSFVTNMCVS